MVVDLRVDHSLTVEMLSVLCFVVNERTHKYDIISQVKYNRDLCKVILGIWSWSVLQFTMVFTATKAPRREVVSSVSAPNTSADGTCCTPDVVGIIMSIFMQDGPFLVLRMLLIFQYSVFSYTNMFFTCKNTLVQLH